jgi:hypothetical protein
LKAPVRSAAQGIQLLYRRIYCRWRFARSRIDGRGFHASFR